MQFQEFQATLSASKPPAGLSILLQALWLDAKGNWEAAHQLVDNLEDKKSCWLHAYLHRKEGDQGNAKYWYTRAGKEMPFYSLDREWEEIVLEFLQ